MTTYLLIWNPANSDYNANNLEQDIASLHSGDDVEIEWNIRQMRDVKYGGRFFVHSTGEGGGICMAGYFCGDAIDDDSEELSAAIDPLLIFDTRSLKTISLAEAGNENDCLKLDDQRAAEIEEQWLEFIFNHKDFDGVKSAKSWNFELENFESIPQTLQQRLMQKLGNRCERCGRTAEEVDELAYHFIAEGGNELTDHLHCYCNNCWFGEDK